MVDCYCNIFGTKPKLSFSSPLEKGDHPELDTSKFLYSDGIQKYQPMIGAIQWAVSLEILDINTIFMTLSSFKAQPRQGNLYR